MSFSEKKNIIQLGACIGNDHVTQFKNENLYLIDANPLHIDILKEEYPNGHVENLAIVPTDRVGKVVLYYSKKQEPEYSHSSIFRSHLHKHNHANKDILEVKVDGITLETLLNRLKLQQVDILFMDIEGIEDEILIEFPFHKFDIREIQVETTHLKKKNRMFQVLRDSKYKTAKTSYDTKRNCDTLFKKTVN